MDLGSYNKRSVRRIHAFIFHHQHLSPLEINVPRVKDLDCAYPHQTSQGVDGLCVTTQMPTRLAQHNLGGVERPAHCGESPNRPLVPLVGRIEPPD